MERKSIASVPTPAVSAQTRMSIRNLRGVNDELYWRELGHAKWESALGDIASVSTGMKGSIHIAGREILESLSQNTPAAHWGYESASEDANFMTSRIKYAPTRKGGRITRCLVHSSKGIIQDSQAAR